MSLADLFKKHDADDAAQVAALTKARTDLVAAKTATAKAEAARASLQTQLTTATAARDKALADLTAHLALPHYPAPQTAPVPAPTGRKLIAGYAGAPDSIPSVEREITGTWCDRDTWDRLAKAEWMYADDHYQDYLRRYPDRAVDVGIALIPYDMRNSDGKRYDFNALFDEVISGRRDQVFRDMGANLARHGCLTVFARLAWEFNVRNGRDDLGDLTDPSKFKAAWNRAVPLIRAGFAAQARAGQKLYLVFCPLSDGADYEPFYPDNQHVDVIGLDVYATIWGETTPTEAALLADVARHLGKVTAFAIKVGKPLAIPEWANWKRVPDGPADSRGLLDCAPYIDLIFDWAQTCPVEVLYLVYFNLPHNTGITVANTPKSLTRLQARAAAA